MLSSPRMETDVSLHLLQWLHHPGSILEQGLLSSGSQNPLEALSCWEPSSKPGSQTEAWTCNQ